MNERFRIAINAQLTPEGAAGGTTTVLRALTALAYLEGGAEEYLFIGPHEDPEWLRPLLPPRQRIVRGPAPAKVTPDMLERLKGRLGPLRPAARRLKGIFNTQAVASTQGAGDGSLPEGRSRAVSSDFYEGLGCDVIHFPFQSYASCRVPTVFNPHDVQHLHHPEFFPPSEIARRETLYPAACRAAHTVVVASQFVKRDIVGHYGIAPAKVQVIPWAPPPPEPASTTDGGAFLEKHSLTGQRFALYPAMTWEHKNHLRLLEALARLRDGRSLELRFVCTGFKTDFWPHIERRIKDLGLAAQVTFPGLVSREELSALYRAAQFVFIPTLFEAASAPMFEAWQHGVAVACSAVTSLPEQAAGAALLFDPASVEGMAAALARMTTDARLRNELKRRAVRRLEDFSLERTAKAYRAVYRRAAGRALSEEDRCLLGWNWTSRPPVEVEAHEHAPTLHR